MWKQTSHVCVRLYKYIYTCMYSNNRNSYDDKVVPTYATLVMGNLENTLFERMSGKFDDFVHL